MEAKSFEDLRKQYLNEHFTQYKDFTKLLITLAGITIPLLLTVISREESAPLLLRLPLLGFLLSLGSGVVCQHQIMMAPIQHLYEAERFQANALKNDREQEPISQRRLPSNLQRNAYKIQVGSFVLSFALVVIHFLCG